MQLKLYNKTIRTDYERAELQRQFRRLAGDEFDMVRRYLKQTIEQRLDTLSQSNDEVTIHRCQGQVRALIDFLEAVERSTKH